MKWHKEGVNTFQSAIEPTGAELIGWKNVRDNIYQMSEERRVVRYILNDGLSYGQCKDINYQTDFYDNEEHCPLYEQLQAIHEKFDSIHIDTFWFQDWHFLEEIIKMIPPFQNIQELNRTIGESHIFPSQFLDETMPAFPTNENCACYQFQMRR